MDHADKGEGRGAALTAAAVGITHRDARPILSRFHDVPQSIDEWVATLKLESMGIKIDVLTPEQ